MLENKRVNMIISLLIAIALWAFVIGEVNPEATRVYRDIPIQVIQEDVLDENDLAVLSVSDTTMSVTLTGNRSEVNQVREKDIVATVDVSQAEKGENELRIFVKVPSKVEVEAQSIDKVTVVVEDKVSKDVPVQVRYKGTFDGEEEPITIEQGVEYVTVTGAATNIARVNHVVALVPEETVTEDESTFDSRLYPVDASGNRVYNVELSMTTVQITAELAKTKTVPLEVPIIETENMEISRTVTVPETITVKGRSADLDAIESITAEPINMNDITMSTVVEVVPILPENVEVSVDTEKLTAAIQVVQRLSKTLVLSADQITLDNLGVEYDAEILTKEIKITIAGNQDLVNSITEDNFTLSADLSGKEKGTHTVKLDVECIVTSVDIDYNPVNIKVRVDKAKADETPDDNKQDDDGADDTQNNDNNEENKNNDNEDNIEE